MNTPAKVARGAGRRGPTVKVPQGIWTFVKRLKDLKLFGEILANTLWRDVCYLHTCVYQMLTAPALDLQLQTVLLENKQRGGACQDSALG